MGRTLAETIRETTRDHLLNSGGLLFAQCVTAVGWIGGTVPELTEEQGIRELSMADSAGGGIAVGAALSGRRPLYVIRYQGFMWYNAPSIVNYAAKSKEMWGVPCPLCVRSIAMEGGVGPVASAPHHGMVMRMPGIPVMAPMTPKEWLEAWHYFLAHDDPIYISEHRRGFSIDYEMEDIYRTGAKITIFGITAARLSIVEAAERLAAEGIPVNVVHIKWLKPLYVSEDGIAHLKQSSMGLVVDSDFVIAGTARSIAYDLMHWSGVPVHALGLEERTAGFAPHLDNGTPTPEKVIAHVRRIIGLN